MKKIITFGEIMMRLNPEGYLRFKQANNFNVSYAGGEANVAVSLANFGLNAAFVSKIPKNEIGESAINFLRQHGVITSTIKQEGSRLGIYFIEKGCSQRPSKVIYDRAHSAISEAKETDFDWDEIFADADWFHFTGITPALSKTLPKICLKALKIAKAKGLTISCDLNYRNKLWRKSEAKKVMSTLMPYVDICIANEEDAADVFGIHAKNTDVNSGQISPESYIQVAKQIKKDFGCKKVAITLRESLSASINKWSGMLFDGKNACFSPIYTIDIVDRVGGGDSFAAGLIYALTQKYDTQKAINFAAAASCLKHTIEQDFNLVSVQEVELLAAGNASGRVQR